MVRFISFVLYEFPDDIADCNGNDDDARENAPNSLGDEISECIKI